MVNSRIYFLDVLKTVLVQSEATALWSHNFLLYFTSKSISHQGHFFLTYLGQRLMRRRENCQNLSETWLYMCLLT